jgi:hypothetical protein
VPGKITRISVTYTVDTPDGPRRTFHSLPRMRRHIRPERLRAPPMTAQPPPAPGRPLSFRIWHKPL